MFVIYENNLTREGNKFWSKQKFPYHEFRLTPTGEPIQVCIESDPTMTTVAWFLRPSIFFGCLYCFYFVFVYFVFFWGGGFSFPFKNSSKIFDELKTLTFKQSFFIYLCETCMLFINAILPPFIYFSSNHSFLGWLKW